MEYVIGIILIALLQYLYFTGRTGFGRVKYKVMAPSCKGDETWERMFRVQQNTMEQLVVFVPGMLAFAHLVSVTWALLPGVLFVLGRAIFARAYIAEPESRALGMILTMFSNVALVVGALIGLGLSLAKASA
jgi:uncharacterized membrane protein YecN with MAPEG domain